MNSVTISGYVVKDGKYEMVGSTTEFKFFVKTYSTYSSEVTLLPCKCEGWLADKAYRDMCANAYVEIYGELIRENSSKWYIKVVTLSCKKPKTKTQFYIRSTEFLELYTPKNVLERAEMCDKQEEK